MMDVWHTDPLTGELCGHSTADESPLEPGVWLIPAHGVTTEPPAVVAGQARIWSDGAWGYVADHRGETRWLDHATSYIVAVLGEPDGVTERPPPSATLNVGTDANNIVQLDSSSRLPAVDGSLLTNLAMRVKAFVQFAGSNGAIRGTPLNVSSVIRNATGNYTVTFTNAMPDTNYTVVGTFGAASGTVTAYAPQIPADTRLTGSVGIRAHNYDPDTYCVIVME